MTLTRRSVLTSLAGIGLTAAAPAFASGGRLQVVATTGMIADAAMAVGGDAVDVRALMGPGVDPHSYRQTRTDIVALTRADLVLYHGLFLEAQMEDFLLRLSARQPVVPVAEVLPREQLLTNEVYADKFDPHVWMDPALWVEVSARIEQVLTEARPDDAAAFRANRIAYTDTLTALSAYAAQVTATVPGDKRVLVTAHDAFRYFGRAFDFEVLGIQGISTESEAGLNRIQKLVDTLVSRRIGAVFVESSVSDRNVRALIEGAAAQGHDVVIGGELFSDAMGEPGSYEGTYPGMIDHNVTVITRALGGDAPARGMADRLLAGT